MARAYTYEALRDTYAVLWRKMQFTADKRAAIEAEARAIYRNMSRYLDVQRRTGVPAAIIAVIHNRESSRNFNTYLGNGQALSRVTTIVPIGRGPFPSWEEGAVDALKIDRLDQVKVWTIERACYSLESYNGFGYRQFAADDEDGLVDSPYLWAGTSIQDPGKYVADGRWNRSAWDSQLGCLPVLAAIWAIDPSLRLPMAGEAAPVKPADPPPAIPAAVPVVVGGFAAAAMFAQELIAFASAHPVAATAIVGVAGVVVRMIFKRRT